MESIGGSALALMNKLLHEYLLKTFSIMSDSVYTLAVVFVTLYLVIIGYLAIKGKIGESTGELVMLVFSVPIAFGIFFHISFFLEWVYQPILATMLGLMGIAMGGETFTFASIFSPVDESFAGIFNAVDKITNQMDSWDLGLKVKVFIVSALLGLIFGVLYVVFTVLIITSIFSLHVMMVLAPIFGMMAAFKPTRSYFFSWLKINITYALVPVFTAIVMGITMVFIDAAITDITNIDVAEDGVFTKAVGSALFVGILSITLHLKAPEYASSITGAQISGLGGFFATAGGAAYAGATLAGMAGGNKLLSAGKGALAAGASNVLQNGLVGVAQNAYSKMRGFVK